MLFVENAKPGDLILGDKSARIISFGEFQKFRLEVVELEGTGLEEFKGKRGAAFFFEDRRIVLKANNMPLSVDKDINVGSRIR